MARKGSSCVDGVSLTGHAIDDSGVEVALIPHTIEHTAFAQAKAGDAVNLEIDLVARYVERLLTAGAGACASPRSPNWSKNCAPGVWSWSSTTRTARTRAT